MAQKTLLLPLYPESCLIRSNDTAVPMKRRVNATSHPKILCDFGYSDPSRVFWSFPVPKVADLNGLSYVDDLVLILKWVCQSGIGGQVQWKGRVAYVNDGDNYDPAFVISQLSTPQVYDESTDQGVEFEQEIVFTGGVSSLSLGAENTRIIVEVERELAVSLNDVVSLVSGAVLLKYNVEDMPSPPLMIDASDAISFWPMNETNNPSVAHQDAVGGHNFAGRVGFPVAPAHPPFTMIEGVGLAALSTQVTHADFRINGDITVYHEFLGGWSGDHFIGCWDVGRTTDPLWGVGSVGSLFAVWDKASDTTIQRVFGHPYVNNASGYPAIPIFMIRRSNVWEIWIGDNLKASITGFSGARTVLGTEAMVIGHSATAKAFGKVAVWDNALSAGRIQAEIARRYGYNL